MPYHNHPPPSRLLLLIMICGSLLVALPPATAQPQSLPTGGQTPMPEDWIDADTGHRLVRLSRRPGSNRSFYFHNNPFLKTADGKGDLMIFYGETGRGNQLFVLDLQTLESRQLTDHPSRIGGEIVGPQRREVFYQSRDSVFAVHVDNGKSRLVAVLPDSLDGGITTLNADETRLGGSLASGEAKRKILEQHPEKSGYFNRIYEAKIPHTLFSLDLESGELRYLHTDTAWLNHVQFSPTDPDLLMFCHEGPWHLVDRIWTIDLGTGGIEKIHRRTVHREIAGHEFFSRDGRKIWYDLQVPRGETFYLAAVDLETGDSTRYTLERNEWSIHYNISPDQQWFSGDGGDPGQVAKAPDGQWIYLFKPVGNKFESEKLVNMQHHDYDLEPNVHFSPDGRWIIFRANFEGKSQIYAAEIQKAKP